MLFGNLPGACRRQSRLRKYKGANEQNFGAKKKQFSDLFFFLNDRICSFAPLDFRNLFWNGQRQCTLRILSDSKPGDSI